MDSQNTAAILYLPYIICGDTKGLVEKPVKTAEPPSLLKADRIILPEDLDLTGFWKGL